MKKKILENIKTLFYALVIALIIRSFFFQPFYIPSSSMEPGLLIGDRLFVSKYSYGYSRHSLPFSPKIYNKRIFEKMNDIKKDWKNDNVAKFICCMTLFWPNGKNYLSKGIIKGKISTKKKGKNGFGYDPIFIPDGYNKTFGEMEPELKMSIDHRFKAYLQIKKFFN